MLARACLSGRHLFKEILFFIPPSTICFKACIFYEYLNVWLTEYKLSHQQHLAVFRARKVLFPQKRVSWADISVKKVTDLSVKTTFVFLDLIFSSQNRMCRSLLTQVTLLKV